MRKTFAAIAGVCVIGVTTAVWTAAQQRQTVAFNPTSIDEVLQAVRADLQGTRADIIAKNVTLTPAQAAKFWPMYEGYQAEQNLIMDDQLRGIQRYIENADKLDDGGALDLINAHLNRDSQMVSLRKKWLGEFRIILGAKLASRVMQIDRRLSLAHQMDFASKIPLVH